MGFPFDGFLYVSEAYGRGLESLENEGSVFPHQERQTLGGTVLFPSVAAPVAPLPSPCGDSARSGCRVCPSFPTQRSWLELTGDGGEKQGSETWSLSPSPMGEREEYTHPPSPIFPLRRRHVRQP